MKTTNYKFKSASGICEINAWQWKPEGEVLAVIQLHHGMAEHCGRYKDTIKTLTNMGYAVFMNDMLNHGLSNKNPEELGYFGEKNGYKDIIKDTRKLTEIAKKEYPDKKFIIAGHSMGSLVVRCYLSKYKDVDGAIIIGTSGTNSLAPLSILLTGVVGFIRGKKYKSKLINDLGFKAFSKPFENRTEFDWLSRNLKSVDDYINDPKCGFIFSARGFDDLARLAIECNNKSWYENIQKDLPILIISGGMDPVGNYSKGIQEVIDKLHCSGHSNVQSKIYDEARHEILNETNKEEVYNDINNWIRKFVI